MFSLRTFPSNSYSISVFALTLLYNTVLLLLTRDATLRELYSVSSERALNWLIDEFVIVTLVDLSFEVPFKTPFSSNSVIEIEYPFSLKVTNSELALNELENFTRESDVIYFCTSP